MAGGIDFSAALTAWTAMRTQVAALSMAAPR